MLVSCESDDRPLAKADCRALGGNQAGGLYLSHPPPRSKYQFVRSSSSSKSAESSGRQRPLKLISNYGLSLWLADRCSVCTFTLSASTRRPYSMCNSPIMINGLDDEAKSRADTVHIFSHDLLHYRRLASVVQPSVETVSRSLTCLRW